jgi:hypothetical protein
MLMTEATAPKSTSFAVGAKRPRIVLTAAAALALAVAAGLPTAIMIYGRMKSELAPLLPFLVAGSVLLAGILILSRLRHRLAFGVRLALSFLLSAGWIGVGVAILGEPKSSAVMVLQLVLFTGAILAWTTWLAPKRNGPLGSKNA